MAKGYWVVFADVSDPEGYKSYIAANGKALASTERAFSLAAARPNRKKVSRGRG